MIALIDKDYTFNLWGVNGDLIGKFKGHDRQINSAIVSSDGILIASASDDKTIRLWRKDGSLMKEIVGHKDKVNQISFSPDSKTLISASDDKTVKLWDINGNFIRDIGKYQDKVLQVGFTSDGLSIATLSGNRSGNKFNLWKLDGSEIKSLSNVGMGPRENPKFGFNSDNSVLGLSNGSRKSGNDDESIYSSLQLLNGLWFKNAYLSSVNSYSGIPFSKNGQTINLKNDSELIVLNADIDDLIARSCTFLSGYLKNNPQLSNDEKHLCDDGPIQK